MKLPSMRQAAQEARDTLLRFPTVIAIAMLGTIAALILADFEGPPQPSIFFNILLAALLGIPLLTALVLLGERRRWGMPMAMAVQCVGVLLLIGFALTVPTDLSNAPAITLIRFLILAVGLHLLVAAAPFAGKGEVNGFWQFNKTLFLRFLMAAVFSFVFWAGLSLALAAVTHLFEIDIRGVRYFQLWIIIAGVFNTWFFLAGVPDDLVHLDTVSDYPKGLKVFAQYVLFPLALIYLVILYAYLVKILVDWEWPIGWVSKLILGFSGTGMFSLLLLHPIAGRIENVWIRNAARWFYVILIPLVVMLFFAVGRRVSEYGMTEGRYLAIVLGAWLAVMIVYFTLSKAKSIKIIPASLCLLAFLVSFGPWGVFSTSERSQIGRLTTVLERTGILADGKVRPTHGNLSHDDTKQISAILSYLHDIHGYQGIQSWFGESLKEDSTRSGVAYKNPALVTRMMGIEYIANWQRPPGGMIFLKADRNGALDIRGYDRMVPGQEIRSATERRELPGEGIFYQMSSQMDTLKFTRMRDGKEQEVLQIDLRPHLERLLKEYASASAEGISPESMAISSAGAGLKAKVCLWLVQVEQRGQETKPLHYSAAIFYTVKTEGDLSSHP